MRETVTPYKTVAPKKQQVQTMFDRIAPRYDLLNRVLSFGIDKSWRRKAIRELATYRPKQILDVACGTGDFAIAALRVRPEKITGIDIAEEMLAEGNRKLAKKKTGKLIELMKADSEQLPFPDTTFDAVTVAFGVRNFENLDRGLSEINRVLRVEAPLVILEFSTPKTFPFRQIYHFYFSTILPFMGRLLSKDAKAYTYLYESVQAFPEGDAFLGILSKAGFKNCRVKRFTFGVCSLYIAEK
jgi:demethylmenaquinone methyltransferase/2-methoxy-6-polyprenyl-1,4-benzoquinol methylase